MIDPWRHLIGQIRSGRTREIVWPTVARTRDGAIVLMLDPAHRCRWGAALTLVPPPRPATQATWRKAGTAAATLLVATTLAALVALASRQFLQSAAADTTNGKPVATAMEGHIDWSTIRYPESVFVDLIRRSGSLGAAMPGEVSHTSSRSASTAARAGEALRLAHSAAASATRLRAIGEQEPIEVRSFAMLASLDLVSEPAARLTMSDADVVVPLVARKVTKAKRTPIVPAKKSATAKKKSKKATVVPKRARSRVAAVDMLELRNRWLSENDGRRKQR